MSKSMTAAIVIMFAGYTIASYGYVLLRGWDIPFRQWVDPLDAYQWPPGGLPGSIPAGQVFPNQASLDPWGSGVFSAIQQSAANLSGGSSGGGG